MMRESIANKIERSIYARPRGSIFFRNNFADLGSAEAVRQTLNRLEKKGILIRLSQGIYLYPKKHKVLGVIYPSLDELANAIAKRDKARIIPTGIQALNKLGLSNQVPVNAVYLIDGASRSVQIGKGSIKFKKASPKALSVKNEINTLIIQALKELGEDQVDEIIKAKLREIIKNIDPEIVKKDMKLAPVWISELVLELL
jgi:ribosomal protein S19E (S16A)